MRLFGFIGRKKLTQSQLQQIHRQEKILADSLKIIQETEKIDTFFSRCKTANDAINAIGVIAGANTKCIAGGQASASECAESLAKEIPDQLNKCLDRYFMKETIRIMGLTRGRMSKAKGVLAIIEEYGLDMPEECLEHGRLLAKKLIKKVEDVEKE